MAVKEIRVPSRGMQQMDVHMVSVMSDLIKREDAIKAMGDYLERLEVSRRYAKSILNKLPTIEPKRGEWINKHEWENGFFERECSVCGAMKPILMHIAKINFCPNCGADMREREGE